MLNYLVSNVVDEIVEKNMESARHNLGQQTDTYQDMDGTPVRGVNTGENYHEVDIAGFMDKVIQNENAPTGLGDYVDGLRGDAWKGLIQRILDKANAQLARQWQALKQAAIEEYDNQLATPLPANPQEVLKSLVSDAYGVSERSIIPTDKSAMDDPDVSLLIGDFLSMFPSYDYLEDMYSFIEYALDKMPDWVDEWSYSTYGAYGVVLSFKFKDYCENTRN